MLFFWVREAFGDAMLRTFQSGIELHPVAERSGYNFKVTLQKLDSSRLTGTGSGIKVVCGSYHDGKFWES